MKTNKITREIDKCSELEPWKGRVGALVVD